MTAYEFGKKAFENEKLRVPAQDRYFLDTLQGLQIGEGVEPMNQWLKGFDDAKRVWEKEYMATQGF